MPLSLSRKEGERVFIGDHIIVEVLHIRGTQVRLSITAPPDVTVDREEVVLRRRVEEQCDGE